MYWDKDPTWVLPKIPSSCHRQFVYPSLYIIITDIFIRRYKRVKNVNCRYGLNVSEGLSLSATDRQINDTTIGSVRTSFTLYRQTDSSPPPPGHDVQSPP